MGNMKIRNILRFVCRIIDILTKRRYCFVSPSVKISNVASSGELNYLTEFEIEFAKGIGGGECVSFGAGRMAFYAILKAIGINQNDEVILTGFTCSVMANAVLRLGAKVKYCDVDRDTLGMSPQALKDTISDRTKVVVAQHSFGIPCKIDEICSICKKKGVYLVEDCALSYMSKYKGKYVGDYGDAAIFSTDHTKPINTLIGGLAYSRNSNLLSALRLIQRESPDFSKDHIARVLERYRLEHRLIKRGHYNNYLLWYYFHLLRLRLKHQSDQVYLTLDTSPYNEESWYAYPSRLPNSVAKLGIAVLKKYRNEIDTRKRILSNYIKLLDRSRLPQAYFDEESEIIPLRLVFYSLGNNKNERVWKYLCGVWFLNPIINTDCELKSLCYYNTCENSELIGKEIINIPVLFDRRDRDFLYNIITDVQ